MKLEDIILYDGTNGEVFFNSVYRLFLEETKNGALDEIITKILENVNEDNYTDFIRKILIMTIKTMEERDKYREKLDYVENLFTR